MLRPTRPNSAKNLDQVPLLRTAVPGPKAAAMIAADEQVSSPSYTRMYPLAVARGDGAVIEDVDGNRFLDFTAGIAVCASGHCHPRVVRAIRRQAGKLLHMSGTDFYYGPQVELAQTLAKIAPGPSPKRVFFANSGTEAIEAGIKLARWHTKRQNVIAFFGGFHGRTMGSLSLTASKAVQRRGFGNLLPGVAHVDYPNAYRGISVDETFRQLDRLFLRTLSPEEVAAIVVEPIQGEGGYLVPPDDFLPRLKEFASKHAIMLMVDEVQSGFGRTGRMFACDWLGIEPDILCLAKGIASGMPLGAMIARAEVMNWPPGAHASTFGGNPVACAAALETIGLIQEELAANAGDTGELLRSGLEALAQRHAIVGEVRGRGLMIGVELVTDRQAKEPAKQMCSDVIQACFRRGLLLLPCGQSTLRFCPPLVITREHVETCLRILDEALAEVTSKK
jgi:4-aminobutyrate aminotransferase